MTPKQRKREAQKQAKLEAAKPAPPAYFGLFNPTATNDDPEWDIFSESTGILQRLQQLQRRYRESDLLDLLQGCLMGPALDWFKDQPEFISLHDFSIALTNAFPPEQVNSSSLSISAPDLTSETSESPADPALAAPAAPPAPSAPQEQQKLEVPIPDRCQWCQLDYKFWDSHRLQYPSCAARNQQAYDSALQFLEGHASEAIEKLAVSTLSGPQGQQELKSTPELQDIGIFDPTLTYEDRRFSEATDFLQHLQQCRYQYRESDLLFLLPSCLYGPAFDIWFDKQTTMESAPLSEWIETLRIDFANAPFAKAKTPKMTCMRCNSSFNSKEKHREHVRKQHAKKPVSCSSLSIDTAKSVCETEENSAAIEVPALQAPHILPTAPRNHVASETTSPKSSSLPTEAPKVVSELMESVSNQEATDTRAICKLCEQSLNSNRELYEHIRNHEALKPAKDSYLSINAVNLVCETMEKSAATDSSAPQEPDTPPATPGSQKSWYSMTSQPVPAPTHSGLPIATYKISPKPVESAVANCSLTLPSTPSHTPVPKHQEFHLQKSYLTMDELYRMFAGKPRPFGLQQHQIRCRSPQGFGFRQPGRPCSTPSKKPYLTIENLSEMFDGKPRKKSLFQGQNHVPSRGFSSGQSRITAYFKPASNQKPSVSQDSKSSKPKSLNQHMPAESIRTAFSEILSEKSAKLSYKLSDVSCTNLKPPVETPFFIFILLRLLPTFLLALAFVSAIFVTRMSCISAYQQVISAIGRAKIKFVASGRS